MNIDLQRKIDRIAGKIICRIFSLLPAKGTPSSEDAKPSKFLVILLSEMGSLVLSKPMFDHIEEKYPHASIYALCFERNREFLEILDLIPSGNIFTVRGESLRGLFWDSIRTLINIRKQKIDTVLDCELFSRISSIYSFLSGAKFRVGFHPYTQEGLFRGDFINRRVLYNPYLHITEQFINLAEAIESDQAPTVKRKIENKPFENPRIEIGQREQEELLRRFKDDFPQIEGKKLVLLYPSGGLLPIRAWPLENFCLVAEALVKNGYGVGIIGMENDRTFADRILSHCQSNSCIDLTGYTKTVRELMILFHFASLLITNDGGPGHFASMTPIPVIILFGPETPTIYGSLDGKAVNCYVPLSCSPCLTAYNHRNSPCDGDNVCLKSIEPKDVLEQAYRLLQTQNPSFLEEAAIDWNN
jgi:ADP-heptose:LPS heptosyltransferase